MYVSYRKNDEVYWTKTKHRIPRGEYVVTDGKSFARARCGNRLSALPQEPVMNAGEPGEDRLDKPEAPGDMYLASLNPSAGDPLFSIPASADEQPVLDAMSSAPRAAAASPGSSFAGNAGSGAFPMGGGFGATPYVAQRNRTSNPSSSAGVPGTQSVPTSNSAEGGTTSAVVMIPTPEPSGLALLIGGGASLMLGLLALRGRHG